MIVKLNEKNNNHPDLSPDQLYVVIGIEANDYRILNNNGRPYLYPHEIFVVHDSHEPGDWISEIGEEGERYAYPPTLNSPGFFEDYFEGDEQTVSQFWRVLNQHLALAV
jgi:hypothetical protein